MRGSREGEGGEPFPETDDAPSKLVSGVSQVGEVLSAVVLLLLGVGAIVLFALDPLRWTPLALGPAGWQVNRAARIFRGLRDPQAVVPALRSSIAAWVTHVRSKPSGGKAP